MFTTQRLQHIIIATAVLISFGVLVHDTKIDQAAAVALALPFGLTLLAGLPELKTEGHTHIERASFQRTVQATNSMPPRSDNRKYLLTKHVRGFNIPEPHTMLYDPTLV